MAREIPSTAVEIQTGLWLNTSTFTYNGVDYLRRELYSSEGYCFYTTENDAYDEEGNLVRIYYQYMSLDQLADINTFHSIPIEEGIEIAGNPTKPEIA